MTLSHSGFELSLVILDETADSVEESDLQTVRNGLRDHNREFVDTPSWYTILVTARDAAGTLAGGLEGELGWGWLHVRHLWVAPPFRRNGLGSRLLDKAERFAREQRCLGTYLDTFQFQAPEFYEDRGYSAFGVLEGFPPGSRRIYYRKTFTSPEPAT